jgi:DNA processing protein
VRRVDIVSGGAYGIDAAAHRAALAADGQTVIISAGGLDRPYPSGHATLYDGVAESGLLVSESPPGSAPQRHRFLSRNRLIAALSTGTLVVEAAARSGALNTARHCQILGRTLMAVPGPVTSVMSAGCHRLLSSDAEPAILVASVDDVLAAVGSAGEGLDASAGADGPNTAGGHAAGMADPQSARSAPAEQRHAKVPDELRARLDRLDPLSRRVFDGVPARRAIREDDLARRAGVTAVQAIRALPALRLAGLVESTDEGFRLAAVFRSRGGDR